MDKVINVRYVVNICDFIDGYCDWVEVHEETLVTTLKDLILKLTNDFAAECKQNDIWNNCHYDNNGNIEEFIFYSSNDDTKEYVYTIID